MHCRHRVNGATAVAKRHRDLNMIAKEALKVTFDVVYRTVRRSLEKLRPLSCAREGTRKRYTGSSAQSLLFWSVSCTALTVSGPRRLSAISLTVQSSSHTAVGRRRSLISQSDKHRLTCIARAASMASGVEGCVKPIHQRNGAPSTDRRLPVRDG
jgi:hypothetical protein